MNGRRCTYPMALLALLFGCGARQTGAQGAIGPENPTLHAAASERMFPEVQGAWLGAQGSAGRGACVVSGRYLCVLWLPKEEPVLPEAASEQVAFEARWASTIIEHSESRCGSFSMQGNRMTVSWEISSYPPVEGTTSRFDVSRAGDALSLVSAESGKRYAYTQRKRSLSGEALAIAQSMNGAWLSVVPDYAAAIAVVHDGFMCTTRLYDRNRPRAPQDTTAEARSRWVSELFATTQTKCAEFLHVEGSKANGFQASFRWALSERPTGGVTVPALMALMDDHLLADLRPVGDRLYAYRRLH